MDKIQKTDADMDLNPYPHAYMMHQFREKMPDISFYQTQENMAIAMAHFLKMKEEFFNTRLAWVEKILPNGVYSIRLHPGGRTHNMYGEDSARSLMSNWLNQS